MNRRLFLLLMVAALVLFPQGGWGQGALADPQALAAQSLRGYTHVFIAYVIAWVLILGWVISIARRLGRVERALEQ